MLLTVPDHAIYAASQTGFNKFHPSPDFFPLRSDVRPMIYAYEDSNPQYNGLLKVGYTTIGVEQRVAQQYPTKRPDGKLPYRIVFAKSAMYSKGVEKWHY